MSAVVEFRVSGVKGVVRQMQRLGGAARADLLEDLMEESSEPIVKAAKGRAPSDVIADGIQVVNIEVIDHGEIVSEIGLPGGRKAWFHGLFVELGTGPRVQKSTGRRTGSMPADPFLRPGFDAGKALAQRVFWAGMKRRLEAMEHG